MTTEAWEHDSSNADTVPAAGAAANPPPESGPGGSEKQREWMIHLWGNTQVGKTTLLSAAFYHDARAFPIIDTVKSFEELQVKFGRDYRRLETNEPIPFTPGIVDTCLFTQGGNILRFRDIRGSMTDRAEDPAILPDVKAAHGVLFVLEWSDRDLPRQLSAVRAIQDLCHGQNKAVGLALTKCECVFDELDGAWDRPKDWWRRAGLWDQYESQFRRFGEAIWPTSAYGYCQGLPAVIIGEFGQLMPYRINPKGVTAPFLWLINEIGAY